MQIGCEQFDEEARFYFPLEHLLYSAPSRKRTMSLNNSEMESGGGEGSLRALSPRLAAFLGQYVLLVFQSSEWNPARSEILSHYRQSFSTFSGHSSGNPSGESPGGSPSRSKVAFISGLETDEILAREYGVTGRNAVILIGPEGQVLWSKVVDGSEIPSPEALLSELRDQFPTLQTHVRSNALPDMLPNMWGDITRREFLGAAALVTLIVCLPPVAKAAVLGASGLKSEGGREVDVTLKVNGKDRVLRIEPRVTLLDALRERLDLTGTKKGCDRGQCGACTVIIDGRRVNSCLTLAMLQQGKAITTVEGLAQGEQLHPVQAAFLKHDGFQCGYCTPGQIMSAVGLLSEPCGKRDEDVRECMSGNLCRCAAYDNIISAVQEARGLPRTSAPREL